MLVASVLALAATSCAASGSNEPNVAFTVPGKPTTTIGRDCEPSELVQPPADQKPTVDKGEGEPPTELVTEDLKVGEGREAKAGDDVQMMYTGVLFTDGKEFDSSWGEGRTPFEVTNLGQGQVIDGWNEGIQGMKVGGRRKLVIPPAKAYGDKDQGDIPPNSTLIFVVDLLQVCASTAPPITVSPGSTTPGSTPEGTPGSTPESTASTASTESTTSTAPSGGSSSTTEPGSTSTTAAP